MNINEIAKLAGVSRATVSRYLNDGYVSAEKRRLIKAVIDQTGYVPSSHAQTLRTGKTNLVCVIIPKISSESIGRMVAGISETLAEEGYRTLLANTENDESEEVHYLKILSDNQVDGVILIGTVFTAAHQRAMAELHVPIVVLSQEVEGYSCVYYDDYGSMRELAAHVMRTSRHPAYIGVTSRDLAAGAARSRAFADAAREAGLEVAEGAVRTGNFTYDSGFDLADKIMDQHPDTDLIMCATDNIAAGVISCLRVRGIDVPGRVQVTGVGDSQIARVCMPELTSIHLFYRTSGTEAARLLVHLLDNSSDVRREVKMGFELKLRASTN